MDHWTSPQGSARYFCPFAAVTCLSGCRNPGKSRSMLERSMSPIKCGRLTRYGASGARIGFPICICPDSPKTAQQI
jgi:hypothetical protein